MIMINKILILAFLVTTMAHATSSSQGVFKKIPIDTALITDMKKKNIWNENCPVSIERLSLLSVSYYDFDNHPRHDGKIMVMDIVSDNTLKIFEALFQHKFPIAKIKLINDYGGNDEAAMADNNTSAFNCRKIVGQDQLSIHSYGLAIDLNPAQNPYVLQFYDDKKKGVEIYPLQGMLYLNRINLRPGMVETPINGRGYQNVVDLFRINGFKIWGGQWNMPIDWHHFQLDRLDADKLAKLSTAEAEKYFSSLQK